MLVLLNDDGHFDCNNRDNNYDYDGENYDGPPIPFIFYIYKLDKGIGIAMVVLMTTNRMILTMITIMMMMMMTMMLVTIYIKIGAVCLSVSKSHYFCIQRIWVFFHVYRHLSLFKSVWKPKKRPKIFFSRDLVVSLVSRHF